MCKKQKLEKIKKTAEFQVFLRVFVCWLQSINKFSPLILKSRAVWLLFLDWFNRLKPRFSIKIQWNIYNGRDFNLFRLIISINMKIQNKIEYLIDGTLQQCFLPFHFILIESVLSKISRKYCIYLFICWWMMDKNIYTAYIKYNVLLSIASRISTDTHIAIKI